MMENVTAAVFKAQASFLAAMCKGGRFFVYS